MSTSADLDLRVRPYTHPDVVDLVKTVQAEYVVRYGGPDETAVDPAQFDPPGGIFLVGYERGIPVACGGWRTAAPGVAEIKRMFVVPAARRRGLARIVLTALEDRARAAGFAQVWLETGAMQPEALALYGSTGYVPVEPFGHYRDAPEAHHLGKLLSRAKLSRG